MSYLNSSLNNFYVLYYYNLNKIICYYIDSFHFGDSYVHFESYN